MTQPPCFRGWPAVNPSKYSGGVNLWPFSLPANIPRALRDRISWQGSARSTGTRCCHPPRPTWLLSPAVNHEGLCRYRFPVLAVCAGRAHAPCRGADGAPDLPLPVTWLHQLEFRNALRLRVFRAEITPAQRDASLNAMLADLASGVLAHAVPPLADLTIEAERLSVLHSETLGTRTLDILHVAAAWSWGSPSF